MFSSAAIAQVEVGDKAPSFELLDQNGKSFTSNDVIGREIVVIYFYPKG
jgi:peroxiredoxin Q/BCP